jgi:hypothetical protein
VHPEGDDVTQLVFAHPAGRGQREDHFLARLLQEIQLGLRLLWVVDHRGARAGLDIALEIQRNAAGGPRHVERIERQRSGAAQLEAAAREDKSEQKREGDGFR